MNAKQLAKEYWTLFVIPVVAILLSIIAIITRSPQSWMDIVGIIYIVVSFGAIIITGIYLLLNKRFFHIKPTWWKNLLLSIIFFLISAAIMLAVARI